MIRPLLLLAATSALATPAFAQDHANNHAMHGMAMPSDSTAPTADGAAADDPAGHEAHQHGAPAAPSTIPAPAPADPHAGMAGMDHGAMQNMDHNAMPDMNHGTMDHGNMQGMDHGNHAGHDMSGMNGMAMGQENGTGSNAPPPIPQDNHADSFFSPAEMAHARHAMMRESGGLPTYLLMFNLAEYQVRDGHDGYRWDGEAWFGGDIHRLTLKSEGEGTLHDKVESAEIQALYSRAIGPYFNLQGGVRHDFQPGPPRTYAVLGFEGLAPYQFEVEGAAFLSTAGDLLGRLSGYYDQRLTQRLILQPRAELNFAAQDVKEHGLGAGLTNAELGLRLRYEIRREFAPYVGVSWERKAGGTARLARAAGENTGGFAFVTGIRAWF